MKKKILFISNVDWFFISHRLPIAMEAIKKGYEVHLATKLTDKKSFLIKQGFIIHPIELDRTQKNLINFLRTIAQIFKIIYKFKPNIIHAITIKPVIIGGFASRVLNIPFVASISGLGYVFVSNGIKSKLTKFVVTLLYKLALSGQNIKVIFQNIDDEKIISRICNLKFNQKILIHGSGVDLDIYKPKNKKSKDKIILFASRLLKSKGLLEFVKSAELLKFKNIKFLIAGKLDSENPDCIEFEEMNDWVSRGIVDYVGFNENIINIINNSNIVVLPSYYGEGLPKILIEASACGVPIITTNHPGCRDAIINEVTGILVPIKDHKALSTAILRLIENPQMSKKMGESGRKLALEKYDIKKVVNKHISIYENLISEIN